MTNHSHQPSWMRGFLIFWRMILWISLAVSIFFTVRDDPALLLSWRAPAMLLAVAGFVLVYELYERSSLRRSGSWPLPYRDVLGYLIIQLALVLILLHFSGGFVGALFALMAQVFAALPMRRWPLPTAAIVAVIAVPLGLADAWSTGDWGSVVGFALSMASWVAIAVFVGALFHDRHQHEVLIAELRQAKERLERYATQAEELAALQERTRLAREMHDSLGHALVVVNVKLEAAQRLYSVDPPRGDAELEATRALVRATMADLRRSLGNLRAEPLAHQSLPAALRRVADEARARSGLAIDCAALSELPPLAPAVSEALWRVAREALANVERHAGAASASLSLARADGRLVLRVADDGAGLAPGDLARPGHYGITGMRERVEALGGTLRVAAQPHGGTIVEAQVPIG